MKSALCQLNKVLSFSVIGLAASAFSAFSAPEERLSEFPKETEVLVAATAAFFDSIESSASATERAPAIQVPQLARRIKGEAPDAGTGALMQRGPVKHLTGYGINWYPVDRFLGSVDFMGTWDGNRNLVCGYLLWDLSDPSAPVLDNVTANFIDLDDFKGKTPAEIHEYLLEANCAFGAIDENYAFFDPAG